MLYFVIEDGVDVSAYQELDLAVNAVEPADTPCTRLFDERGQEYPLSIGRRKTRFLGIFPISVDITRRDGDPHEAEQELENVLKTYANKAGIQAPANASLQNLVDLIGSHFGIRSR